jgi:hypothetical protein
MTAKVAPLEIEDLLNEVAHMLTHHVDDRGRFAQIQVRANRLMQTGGSPRLLSFDVLMLTAFGLGETNNVEKWADQILSDGWASAGMLGNACQCLVNVGSLLKANAAAEAMVQQFPDVKRALHFAIKTYQLSLQFSKTIELISRYDLLAVNEVSEFSEKDRRMLSSSVDLMKINSFTDHDFSERLVQSVSAVRGEGFNVCRMGRLVLDDGSFVSHLYVDAEPSKCAELNFVLIDALIENFDDPGTSVFSITCRPFSDYRDSQLTHHS